MARLVAALLLMEPIDFPVDMPVHQSPAAPPAAPDDMLDDAPAVIEVCLMQFACCARCASLLSRPTGSGGRDVLFLFSTARRLRATSRPRR